MYLFYENGYLLANYELSESDSSSTKVIIRTGKQFRWAELEKGNVPDELLSETGYKTSFFYDRIVNFGRITNLFDAIIKYSQNHGYPFAVVNLEQIRINENSLSASINYNPGPLIEFGQPELVNENNINPSFLSSYLMIKPGKRFEQRRIDNVSRLINRVEYLEMSGAPELRFTQNKCYVLLNLKDVKSNRFDGIIGFLPNQNERNKWLITGQLFLKLNNFFKTGKTLLIDWKKPNLLSQQLLVLYNHPAIFNLPVDINTDFEILKQDSSFINRMFTFDFIGKQFRAGNIGMGYEFHSSRLLGARMVNTVEDFDNIDYNIHSYGISYNLYTLNDPFFPSGGIDISARANIGNREIIRNSTIDESLYQGLDENSIQWKIRMKMDKYTSFKSRNILLTRIMGGFMDNPQIFMNDLFRLGGLNTIRGFNENDFYASWYLSGTLEYRYQLENESQILVFADAGGLGFDLNNDWFRDFPFGIGTGFRLSTGAGLLNIYYALGKSETQPFSINYSKIHIGYINRF